MEPQERNLKTLFKTKEGKLIAGVGLLFVSSFIYLATSSDDKTPDQAGPGNAVNTSLPLANADSTAPPKSKLELQASTYMNSPGVRDQGVMPIQGPESVEQAPNRPVGQEVPAQLEDYQYGRARRRVQVDEIEDEIDPSLKPGRSRANEDEQDPEPSSNEQRANIEKQKRLLALLEQYQKDKQAEKVKVAANKRIHKVDDEEAVVSSLNAPKSGTGNNFFGLYSEDKKRLQNVDDDSLNTVRAMIHKDQTIMTGGRVKIRLLEPIKLRGRIVPAGTMIYGLCSFSTGRVNISIQSIQLDGKIIPAQISTYDMDGIPGIYVPNIVAVQSLQQGASTIATSVNVPIGAGANTVGSVVAANAANATIQGVQQYAQRKIMMQKAHLKNNYIVLLR